MPPRAKAAVLLGLGVLLGAAAAIAAFTGPGMLLDLAAGAGLAICP